MKPTRTVLFDQPAWHLAAQTISDQVGLTARRQTEFGTIARNWMSGKYRDDDPETLYFRMRMEFALTEREAAIVIDTLLNYESKTNRRQENTSNMALIGY